MTKHHIKNPHLLIALLGSIVAIGPLAIDMYLPALGKIAEGFSVDESRVQLSLSAYFIGTAVSQILYGPIIDRFGKKPPLYFGFLLFAATSLAIAFTQKIETLILLRFFQAFGGCACVVIPRAMVRDVFSPQDSARIFSHLMLVMGVAPVLAPGLGSLLLINHSWRAIFIFLTAFACILFLLSSRFLPETKAANPDDKISGALKKYLGILRDKNFVICACSGAFAMAGLFSYITAAPFIYMKIFGLLPHQFSIIFSINAIGFIAASQANAKLLKKFSIEKILQKLIFLPLFFGLTLVLATALDATFWPITILFFLLLSSIGAMIPNTTALALANQAAHSGSASALLGTIQFVIATIASLLISKFSNQGIFALGIIFGSCSALGFLTYMLFRRH